MYFGRGRTTSVRAICQIVGYKVNSYSVKRLHKYFVLFRFIAIFAETIIKTIDDTFNPIEFEIFENNNN